MTHGSLDGAAVHPASRAADGIEGWLTVAQADRLARIAAAASDAFSQCSGQTIVEIGSFRGRSTVVLATAAPTATVVAIDPFAGTDRGPNEISGHRDEAERDLVAFRSNLARRGVSARVRHVRAESAHALSSVAAQPILVFVDGAHRYRPAAHDLDQWGRRVADGGTMLVHDAFSSVGVTAAIARHLVVGGRFRYLGRTGSLAEYRADLPAGARARLSNAARQVAEAPWFVRNVAVKIALVLGAPRVWRRLGRTPPPWPY